MPRQQKLKPLKPGFIRGNVIQTSKGNRPIKIGSRTYNYIMKQRTKSNSNYYKTPEQQQITNTYNVLGTYITKPTLTGFTTLLNNSYTFKHRPIMKQTRTLFKDIIKKNLLDEETNKGRNASFYFLTFDQKNTEMTPDGEVKELDQKGINIPLNINNIETLLETIQLSKTEDSYNGDSDAINSILNKGFYNLHITEMKEQPKYNTNTGRLIPRTQKDGAFFPYTNNSNIDLTKYQIYHNQENLIKYEIDGFQSYDVNDEEDREEIQMLINLDLDYHCIYKALDLPEEEQNRIKTMSEDVFSFKRKWLHKTAKAIQKNIMLHFIYDAQTVKRNYTHKDNSTDPNDIIHIALYKGHYFKFELTNYSFYSINHYDEVKDLNNFNNIVRKHKGKYERGRTRKLNSLQLIRMLVEKGLMTLGGAHIDKFLEFKVGMHPEMTANMKKYKNNTFTAYDCNIIGTANIEPRLLKFTYDNFEKGYIEFTDIKIDDDHDLTDEDKKELKKEQEEERQEEIKKGIKPRTPQEEQKRIKKLESNYRIKELERIRKEKEDKKPKAEQTEDWGYGDFEFPEDEPDTW